MLKFNNEPYKAEWKTIDSLDQNGLPKSALEKVEALYQRARTDKNPAQIIKTMTYRLKYLNTLEEDGLVKAIGQLESEISNAEFPTQSIMQSMLGEMYQFYIQANRWQLDNRTDVVNYQNDDIQTWSMEQLVARSMELYEESVQSEALYQVPIQLFDAISTEAKNSEGLRPTLFDFLVHRAIDQFANEQNFVTAPAYRFYLDQGEAFAKWDQFVKVKFITKDTTSNKFRAILLLQELLNRHAKDSDPTALIDADLKRLDFVRQHSVHPEKDSLYLKALETLAATYKGQRQVSEVLYKIAEYHYSLGSGYDARSAPEKRWGYKKAKEDCDRVISDYSGTYGANLCQSLINQIQQPSLYVKSEAVVLPNKPSLIEVSFRNLAKAYIKVVVLSEGEREELDQKNYEDRLDYINGRKTVYQREETLSDEGDFQNHTAETMLGPLPLGYYVLLISDNVGFKAKSGAVSYLSFHVSRIGYLSRNSGTDPLEFVVLDRENGKPMAGVLAEFYTNQYNQRKRTNEYLKIGQATSDENGYVHPDLSNRSYYRVKYTQGNDVLYLEDGYSSYYRDSRPVVQRKNTHFFLDRAIYRPGQTVYFKALILEEGENDIPAVVTDEKVTISFFDANGQEVNKLELKTNIYGTVHGSFIAPEEGLRGSMYLKSSAGNSTRNFRVEEYKRPKFEVVLPALEGEFKLGDTLEITGQAKAFAGNNIDGAKVQYRVVREVRYPWWPWYYGRSPMGGENMEIANGLTETDENGQFTIPFTAIPDRSVDPKNKPAFRFTIYADVTDINGETQSDSRSINLGYASLEASVQVPEDVDRNDALKLNIVTKNLDGQFQAARGKIVIHRLDAPKQIFIDRYWPKPDYYLIEPWRFRENFPYLAYENADEKNTWPRLEQKFVSPFNTGESKDMDLTLQDWPVGHYVLVLQTQDKNGVDLEMEYYFRVMDAKNKELAPGTQYWIQENKESFQPGENLNITLATADDGLNVLYEVDRRRSLVEKRQVTVNKWQQETYAITAADKGNFYVLLTFIKHNRLYQKTMLIPVPWKEKELKMELATFRDKLKPGQEEEWRIKISGPEGERVLAEMVAGMYDASLDQFAANYWTHSYFPTYNYSNKQWRGAQFGARGSSLLANNWQLQIQLEGRAYRDFNWFGFFGGYYGGGPRRRMTLMSAPQMEMDGIAEMRDAEVGMLQKSSAPLSYSANSPDSLAPPPPPAPPGEAEREERKMEDIPVRTNLNETVFFMPQLLTDEAGNIIIKFTMNEALTRWKFMAMAHTSSLQTGYVEKEVVTQKELMVVPNAPRFVREGDEIEFTAKVSNLTEEEIKGVAELTLFDAIHEQPINTMVGNAAPKVQFVAKAGQSTSLSWKIRIPKGGRLMAIKHRITARADKFSDGEESALPVLTNRMLVTETLPMPVRSKETKTFTLESLKNSGTSKTLTNHRYALEFTSNPAWYAVQSLPYLMEYPYDCTEQIFNRFYANSLASSVANKYPRIKQVFDSWQNTEALESNLSKNKELKNILLAETPWVMEAKSEAEQRKNIGLLFDLNRMGREKNAALNKLVERQTISGGFSWFPGGKDSWYITQYLVEGMGHLKKMGVQDLEGSSQAQTMVNNAISFIDRKVIEDYERLERRVKEGNAKWEEDNLNNMVIHYLYARSFFPDQAGDAQLEKITSYYLGQAEKHWLNKGIYQEGMLGLVLHRHQKAEAAMKIIRSLKERAIMNEELGMYWKADRGYFWYQLPIETHALMIELFAEVAKDNKAVDELKLWLLKNKQTNHWKTTKATSSAVYALLSNGSNWLLESNQVSISFPKASAKEEAHITAASKTLEAGTGYFKANWPKEEVNRDLATVKVRNNNDVVAWGAMYWQYFEELDKIKTFEETPLTLKKQLYREVNSDRGPVLEEVTPEMKLIPGDKLKVRIELRVDRPMEYVHMKDMRASGLEPINVLSHYKWNQGLGYYESTGDVATNFFFDNLPRGTYVFEYPLRVAHRGDFSNGVTSIQCMYAPEFSSHSEGIRIQVK
ncbi:MAG: alpha-2-macroglobulin [Saprospiraceae bacterium]|nr:MAG: alpha-2-macroglobulin [Saprospiraceae bacterium]